MVGGLLPQSPEEFLRGMELEEYADEGDQWESE
jgi:hypothetical protein